MTCSTGPSSLYRGVCGRAADHLRRLSVKSVQRIMSVSKVTAINARLGEIPKTDAFLAMLREIGTEAALKILEPVLGPMDDASITYQLDKILAEVGGLRHVVAARAQDPHRVLAQHQAAGEAPAGAAGAEGGAARLSSVRRSTATIERLRPLLGNVVSLDAARRLKAAHGNLGVAWRERGAADWMVDPAEGNRLWKGSTGPRPLSVFPSRSYADNVRRGFVEAIASNDPIAFEHAGFMDGEHIHALVGRRGWVDADGTEIVTAAFERLSA